MTNSKSNSLSFPPSHCPLSPSRAMPTVHHIPLTQQPIAKDSQESMRVGSSPAASGIIFHKRLHKRLHKPWLTSVGTESRESFAQGGCSLCHPNQSVWFVAFECGRHHCLHGYCVSGCTDRRESGGSGGARGQSLACSLVCSVALHKRTGPGLRASFLMCARSELVLNGKFWAGPLAIGVDAGPLEALTHQRLEWGRLKRDGS